MDNCKKVALVFDNAVSGVDIVNCQSVKCQVMGSLPNCQVDKTDGFNMYLSKESENCQFITAKSSEMNISVFTEEGDVVETPIPEQFKTVLQDGKFVTVPNDI